MVTRMRRVCLLLVALCALCVNASAQSLPQPTEEFYVYDGANVLSEETRAHIVFCNAALEADCGAQIVLVTLDSVGDDDIMDYCYALMNQWGVGDARKQNGFMLLMEIQGEDYAWMPGTGLDLELSGGVVGQLVDEYLEPDFARGDYDAAARKFFDALFVRVAKICDSGVTLEDGEALYADYLAQGDSLDAVGAPAATGGISCGATLCVMGGGCMGCGSIGLVLLLLLLALTVFGGGFGYRRYRRYHPPLYPRPPRRPFWFGPRPGMHPRPPRPPRAHSGGFGTGGFGGRRSGGGMRSGGFGSHRGGGGGTRGGGGRRGR